MKLTLSEIAELCGGKIICGDPGTAVTNFFTDSREAKPGLMFVPIKGENNDGHDFIGSALKNGAAASFTDHPIEAPGPLVLVDDCRAALQRTAGKYRERFDIPILGITGSVGKTTAKEMAALAIGAGHKVWKTPGNANSQVGVPITVCGIEPEHTAAVVEMGVSEPGENIMAEKVKLADYLEPGAPLFVSGDNDLLPGLDSGGRFRLVTFGLSEGCQWRGTDIEADSEGQSFICHAPDGRTQAVRLPAPGSHMACDALSALAAADYLGVPLEDAARALSGYIPPKMRQVISHEGGVLLIDDSYNASPDSMRSALGLLAGQNISGHRIAVLATDTPIAVGELGEIIAEGFGPKAICAKDNAQAWELLRELLRPGDAVLVKGSRGMKTEEIVEKIKGR